MAAEVNVILLKKISDISTGYRGLFLRLSDKKQIQLYGDYPELPNGTSMYVEYEWNEEKSKGLLTGYRIPLTERNLSLFEKRIPGFDLDTFKQKVAFHKAMGVLWRKLDKIFDNPYENYAFAKADRLFHRSGREASHRIRLDALRREIIALERKHRKDSMTFEEFLLYADKIEATGAYASLPYHIKASLIESEAFSCKGGIIYDTELLEAAEYIQKDMRYRKKIADSLLSEEDIAAAVINGLDEEQAEALKSLSSTKPAVITGGAGAGKTTVVTAIIQCYSQAKAGAQIMLLAPTGRASRRLAEVTGWEASTIHKGLRLIPTGDGDSEYTLYSEYNKLPHDLIIVDESSMIDTLLMSRLLKAAKDEAKIIFVGDHQQLYPVGVGEPFFDFMTQGYCDVFYLKHNHRQGKNDIAKNAELANQELPFERGTGVKIADVPWEKIPSLLKKIEEVNGALAGPSQVQIISPFNRMNRAINNVLRKDSAESRYGFSVNDKVIAVRNTEDYCNGDVGFVVGVPEKGIEVQFEDGRRVFVGSTDIDDIQLAYSITVHKMQGSECRRVYLFLPKDNNGFIGKRLLYTAVTRAKEELFIYYYDNKRFQAS